MLHGWCFLFLPSAPLKTPGKFLHYKVIKWNLKLYINVWLTVIWGNSANARQVGNPESGLSEGALLFILLCMGREGRLQQALEQAGSKSEEVDGRQQVWGNNVSSGALALTP